MTNRIAVILMTLSDLDGHPPIVSLFKLDLSYSYAPPDKISTDNLAHPAVLLR